MRLDGKVLAAALVAVLAIAAFAFFAGALRAPQPDVPGPIQMRSGTVGAGPEDDDRKNNKSNKGDNTNAGRKIKGPRNGERSGGGPLPAPSDDGAQPVAPPPPPAGDDDGDDHDGDDDGDDDGEDDD